MTRSGLLKGQAGGVFSVPLRWRTTDRSQEMTGLPDN